MQQETKIWHRMRKKSSYLEFRLNVQHPYPAHSRSAHRQFSQAPSCVVGPSIRNQSAYRHRLESLQGGLREAAAKGSWTDFANARYNCLHEFSLGGIPCSPDQIPNEFTKFGSTAAKVSVSNRPVLCTTQLHN